jgi:cyclase|tara:strand:- start:100 stop:864 length:765 start_codon:yes stop_codon:yes gene_type:complete
MESKRLIVGLQMYEGKLIKTNSFKKDNATYLGDVLNAVKIFNEKEVDELILFDLTASKTKKINFELLSKISSVSRMPLSYGGGIDSLDKSTRLLSLGIEKLNFNNLFFSDLNRLKEISNYVGRQSIVLSLDYKLLNDNIYFYYNGGTKKSNLTIDHISNVDIQNIFGEIYLNDIDNDGGMKGYNSQVLLDKIYNKFNMPLTISGGFNSLDNVKKIFSKYKIIGICCSSLFVFKGKNKAVLLSYPNKKDLKILKQ